MFGSLSSRISALGTIVVVAQIVLAGFLVDASLEVRASFSWVTHSGEVIETTSQALTDLEEAESGQRGFIITRNASFVETFEDCLSGAQRNLAEVVDLTADNRVQHELAREIRYLAGQRIEGLRETLALAKSGKFDEAELLIAGGRGQRLMSALADRTRLFLAEERALQEGRIGAAASRLGWVRHLTLAGVAIIVLLVVLVSWLIIRDIRRPLEVIQGAMAQLGQGSEGERITGSMGSREFAALAQGYNVMADHLDAARADQLRSEGELQTANGELRRQGDALLARSAVIELLGGMAHRMQAARTDEELAEIIRVFVPRVLPGFAGALYAHNNSRNLLVPVASWGMEVEADGFAPDCCWALRRGQSHFVAEPGCDIVCGHVHDRDCVYHCEPLLASGEVIGVLYLNGRVEGDDRFQLTVLAENIASALVNHRLQRDLREQTIRDPLTSLFNRRYMEETLELEIARAARSGTPLTVVMCDVDHFKRFNDEFGHDAGDAVLQAVAGVMRSRFRSSDVVCRFGGEEFTILAPGTAAAAMLQRVEFVRDAVARLNATHQGQRLGSTTMSFGIATWEGCMPRDGAALVKAADAALYRAKREGRNRTIVHQANG